MKRILSLIAVVGFSSFAAAEPCSVLIRKKGLFGWANADHAPWETWPVQSDIEGQTVLLGNFVRDPALIDGPLIHVPLIGRMLASLDNSLDRMTGASDSILSRREVFRDTAGGKHVLYFKQLTEGLVIHQTPEELTLYHRHETGRDVFYVFSKGNGNFSSHTENLSIHFNAILDVPLVLPNPDHPRDRERAEELYRLFVSAKDRLRWRN